MRSFSTARKMGSYEQYHKAGNQETQDQGQTIKEVDVAH